MYEGLTDKIEKRLSQAKDEIKDAWSVGTFTTEDVYQSAQLNAKWIGKVEMIDDILEIIQEAKEEYENE